MSLSILYNLKFRFLLTLLLVGSIINVAIGQNAGTLILKGVVKDSLSGESLPFASVYFTELESGVVTNLEGEFEFVIDEYNSTNMVVAQVSYLGFQSKTLTLNRKELDQSEIIINLTPVVKDLGEVTVSDKGKKLTGSKIVAAMLENFPQTFNQGTYVLNGYYRQTSRDIASSEHASYIAADVAFLHDSRMHLPSKLSVNQVRVREDYRTDNMDSLFIDKISLFLNVLSSLRGGLEGKKLWKDVALTSFGSTDGKMRNADSLLTEYQRQFNPLKSALMESRIYDFDLAEELYDPGSLYLMTARYASNLHDEFLDRNVFSIDSILYSESDRIYKVKFLPKKKSSYKHLMPKWTKFVPVGYLYINASDFSIVKYSMQFIAISKDISGSPWTYKVDLDFVKREGLSYPFYLKIAKKEPITAAAQNSVSSHLTEKELLITKIVTAPQGIEKLKAEWTWNPDLYDPSHKFDSHFWKNKSFIKETSDQQRLREALELRISSDNN